MEAQGWKQEGTSGTQIQMETGRDIRGTERKIRGHRNGNEDRDSERDSEDFGLDSDKYTEIRERGSSDKGTEIWERESRTTGRPDSVSRVSRRK